MEELEYARMSSKVRRLRIAANGKFGLLSMFQSGEHISYFINNGVPKDSLMVGVQHEWPDVVVMLIYHPSFEPIKQGDLIPELIPTITTRQ